MKKLLTKSLASLLVGCLSGTAIADQPMPGNASATAAPSLIQNAPAIPSLGQQIHHSPISSTSSCSTCEAAPHRCFVPPMIGDMFFGGLRGSGGVLGGRFTSFVGFADPSGAGVAMELIPINLIDAAPNGLFTSRNPNLPVTFTTLTGIPGLTNQTVLALQPGQAFLDAAQTAFPGGKLLGSQAVPESLANQIPGASNLVRQPGTGPAAGGDILFGTPTGEIEPFPGSTFGENLVAPGGPIAPGDLYVILNTFERAGGGSIFLPEPGGFSRYTRISENGFVLPTDRVFTNFNYLNGVMNGAGVNAFMVGVEKAFLDGQFSIQVNVPIYASTLSFGQNLDDGLGSTAGAFGNVSVWLKYLALQTDTFAVSAGVGVNTPTAEDVRLSAGGAELLRVRNDSVLINPFIGALWLPTDEFFVQGFTQLDVDTCGNRVVVNGEGIGRMRSALLYSIGVGTGFIMYNDNSSTITSIIPMAELHYTTNIGSADSFSTNAGTLTSRTTAIDVLNVTAGVNVGFGEAAYLTIGGGVPIIGSRDRQFDWQVMAQLNVLFGAPR